MIPQLEPNDWSSAGLLNKAQAYAEVMQGFPRDDWKFAVWSTLSLELLAKAGLSAISPTLLADVKQSWANLLFALNIEPKTSNFIPRSIDVSEVFRRLEELIPEYTPELEAFCRKHLSLRNEELHSAAAPFVGTKVTSWLPDYYRACSVLLASMNDSLDRFFGSDEAKVAQAMIAAAEDKSAQSIKKAVAAHQVVWDDKSDAEKTLLVGQSATWATRQDGHRVSCPACNCVAILSGSPVAAPVKTITEDEITETQEYLPSRLECLACGLKISGLSQLSAAGVGDTYTATSIYDANEYFASEDEYRGYEMDFNEP